MSTVTCSARQAPLTPTDTGGGSIVLPYDYVETRSFYVAMAGTYYTDQVGLVLPQPNVWLGLQACTTTFPPKPYFYWWQEWKLGARKCWTSTLPLRYTYIFYQARNPTEANYPSHTTTKLLTWGWSQELTGRQSECSFHWTSEPVKLPSVKIPVNPHSLDDRYTDSEGLSLQDQQRPLDSS